MPWEFWVFYAFTMGMAVGFLPMLWIVLSMYRKTMRQ